jgi:hypothetical protein
MDEESRGFVRQGKEKRKTIAKGAGDKERSLWRLC